MFLAACSGLAACGDDAPRAADPDASGNPTGDGGATGTVCGGFGGGKCADNEFCDYANNTCGVADEGGLCKPKPTACPVNNNANALPSNTSYCGCDGQVYSSECVLNQSGTDLNANGACTPPKGRFNCGFQQCDLATQYCLHDPTKTPDQQYGCVALPKTCASPADCACLSGERCGTSCAGDGGAGLTLTCQ